MLKNARISGKLEVLEAQLVTWPSSLPQLQQVAGDVSCQPYYTSSTRLAGTGVLRSYSLKTKLKCRVSMHYLAYHDTQTAEQACQARRLSQSPARKLCGLAAARQTFWTHAPGNAWTSHEQVRAIISIHRQHATNAVVRTSSGPDASKGLVKHARMDTELEDKENWKAQKPALTHMCIDMP